MDGGWSDERVLEEAIMQPAVPVVYQFDYKTLPKFGVTVFCGRTESGKTSALMEFFYRQRHEFDLVMVFCDSADDCMKYESLCPGAFVYEGFNQTALETLYAIQQANTRAGRKTRALVILDDLAFDRKTLTSKTMKRLFCNGRHARIRTYITLQAPKQIPPEMRKQVKHVVIAREKNPNERKKVFDAFNNVFLTFNEFDRYMRYCTQDYKQMVLYMFQGSSDRVEDNVFWVKPKYPWRKFRCPSRRSHAWCIRNVASNFSSKDRVVLRPNPLLKRR